MNENDLVEMATKIAALEKAVAVLEGKIEEIEKFLFKGNGHPPLTERMAGLEKSNATQTWLLRTTLLAITGNIAGVVALLKKAFGG